MTSFLPIQCFDANSETTIWEGRRQQGIDSHADNWRAQVQQLPATQTRQCRCMVAERWENESDTGHGAGMLRTPECHSIVADSRLHFDGDRIEMLEFVVMPNHAHLLAAFPSAEAMARQVRGWQHDAARAIQRTTGTSRRFWQTEAFDHRVRSEEQFFHFRRYIAANPQEARLKPGEYAHFSKQLERAPVTVVH